MKIVIDIDKEDWKDINNIHFIREDLKFKIGKAIMNGTPLPKGHLDLIERDDVDISLPCFGTDDWIRDQMKEAKIDYQYGDDEDKVFEFGKHLVKGFMNIVYTATTIVKTDKE